MQFRDRQRSTSAQLQRAPHEQLRALRNFSLYRAAKNRRTTGIGGPRSFLAKQLGILCCHLNKVVKRIVGWLAKQRAADCPDGEHNNCDSHRQPGQGIPITEARAVCCDHLGMFASLCRPGIRPNHAAASAARKVSVLTQRYDNARSGTDFAEVALNTKTVDAKSFGKLFSVAVDGNVSPSPSTRLTWISTSGPPRDVLYVATEKNNVYALDAITGEQIWAKNLGPSVPAVDITAFARGELQMGNSWDYKDLYPDIGITSTPVIDLPSGTIFVVAKTKEGPPSTPQYHYRLHAMDMRTGAELQKPADIRGNFRGSAVDARRNKIVFNPFLQLNRPGLLLLNGMVYAAFGSHGDAGPFHGWIFGFRAAAINRPATIFCSTPDRDGTRPPELRGRPLNGTEGGIGSPAQAWRRRTRRDHLSTGDGAWDGRRNFSDSYLKLSGRLKIVDWFTPWNHKDLDSYDVDLGSGGPVLLPGNLLVGGGKEGKLFVIKRDHLGHVSSTLAGARCGKHSANSGDHPS